MATRRSGIGPAVITLLSVVVIGQSAALGWLLLVSPDRHQVRADLARDPMPTLVNMCAAPFAKPAGKPGYDF